MRKRIEREGSVDRRQRLVAVGVLGAALAVGGVAVATGYWGGSAVSPWRRQLTSSLLDGQHIIHCLQGATLELPRRQIALASDSAWWTAVLLAVLLTAAYLLWSRAALARSFAVLALVPCACLLAFPGLVALACRVGAVGWLDAAPPSVVPMLTALLGAAVGCVSDRFSGLFLPPRRRYRNAWRRRRALLHRWGGVALAAAVWLGLAALVAGSLGSSELQRTQRYRASARQAYRAGDYDLAHIAARRLVTFAAAGDEDRFLLAEIAAARGDVAAALRQMQRLAGQGRAGMPAAELWLADRMVQTGEHLESGRSMKRLLRHLETAVAGEPENTRARAALAQLCVATEQFERSHYHLTQIVRKQPEMHLLHARVLVLLGRPHEAAREARTAQRHWEKQAAAQPQSGDLALRLAECHLLLEEFSAGVELLERARARLSESTYRTTLSRHYVAWYDAVSRQTPDQYGRRFELLRRAFGLTPDSRPVVGRLAVMATEPTFERRAQARELLLAAVAGKQIPANVHLVLGADAYRQGQVQTAVSHLEQAYRQAPRRADIVNNLAWYLANAEPPQLARSLELANHLVRLEPQDLRFRETRGQILLKLGRWEEAISDLERALQVMPDYRPLHTALAQAYQQVGQPDLAQAHRRLAAGNKDTAERAVHRPFPDASGS